jgi:hypothetical protein
MVAIAAALMRRVLPAILLLAASAASQKHVATGRSGLEPDTAPPLAEVVSAARQFACVSEGNGEVLALGSRWRAVFGDSDVSFQPAFGRQAARDWPLRLELLTIRRQDAALPTAAPMRRVDQALRRVEFDRGTVVERYEARPEGLELSLVFAEKPPIPTRRCAGARRASAASTSAASSASTTRGAALRAGSADRTTGSCSRCRNRSSRMPATRWCSTP